MRTTTILAAGLGLLTTTACPGGSDDAPPADTETGASTAGTTGSRDTEPAPTSTTASEDTTGSDPTDGTGDTGEPPPGACGAIPTFEDGQRPTAELHVATDGADGPGCGAPDSPCATLGAAADQATPGTAIRIHAGTYSGGGYIEGLSGQADAPIWIGGAPGEAPPLLDGGGQAFQLSRVRYVIVHDLEVQGATDNGINVDDGGLYDDPEATRHVVFRDLYIHDVGMGGNQDCLKLSGLDDFWVLDSTFERCGGGGSGSGVDHVGCHHGVLARNAFRDMPDSGNAIQAKGGSDDLEIRANHFDDCGQRTINIGGSTGFEFFRPPLVMGGENFEARDIRVVANYMRGSVSPLAFVGCVECSAIHNTIVDPTNWVIRILQETTSTPEYDFAPVRDGRIVDNIVFYDRSLLSTTVNVGPDTAPETFEIANNLWYAHDDPGQSDPAAELPAPETAGIYGQDPMLVDPGTNAEIAAGSPAESAGITVPETAGGDVRGECYPDPPTIGAWSETG